MLSLSKKKQKQKQTQQASGYGAGAGTDDSGGSSSSYHTHACSYGSNCLVAALKLLPCTYNKCSNMSHHLCFTESGHVKRQHRGSAEGHGGINYAPCAEHCPICNSAFNSHTT